MTYQFGYASHTQQRLGPSNPMLGTYAAQGHTYSTTPVSTANAGTAQKTYGSYAPLGSIHRNTLLHTTLSPLDTLPVQIPSVATATT